MTNYPSPRSAYTRDGVKTQKNPHHYDEDVRDIEDGRSKPLSAIAETTVMEKFAAFVAFISVGTSLAAMIVFRGPIVLTAGVLSILVGPYAYWQQTQLTDIKALKETEEALYLEVNTLHRENVRLDLDVERLRDSVERLSDVENALEVISKAQNESVDSFETQVQHNKDILASMEKNLKASVLQNLLSVVMGSDTDGNNTIDGNEVDGLIRRLRTINGVSVNEINLKRSLEENNGSVDSIINVMKDVVEDDSGVDAIFTFDS